MSIVAKLCGAAAAALVVLAAVMQPRVNGLSLLALLILAAAGVVLWRRYLRQSACGNGQCPHCRGELETFWTQPCRRRGDGL